MFGSSKQIFVASNAIPLIEDIPNTLTNSIFKSVVQARDMPLGMIDDLNNGINLSMRRFLQYGERKYIHGLPNVYLEFEGLDAVAVKQVLEQIEGKPVTIKELDLTQLSLEGNLNMHLYSELGLRADNSFINLPPVVQTQINNLTSSTSSGNNGLATEIKNQLDSSSSTTSNITETDAEGNETVIGTVTTTTTVTNTVTFISSSFDSNAITANSHFISAVDNTPTVSPLSGWADNFYIDSRFAQTNHAITINYAITIPNVTSQFSIYEVTTTTTDSTIDGSSTSTSNRTYDYTDNRNITKNEQTTYTLIKPIESSFSKYRVTYEVEESGTVINKYWEYDPRTNIYPSLSFNSTVPTEKEVYPIGRIRYNNQNVDRDGNRESEEYKTTKGLMKAIGLELDELTTSLNENPDINDIDHVYILSGINLHTTTKIGKRYLVEFFKLLAERTPSAKSEFDTWLQDYSDSLQGNYLIGWGNTPAPVNNGATSFVISDNGLRVSILFRYIQVTTHTGEYKPDAKRGEVDAEDVMNMHVINYTDSEGRSKSKRIDLSKRVFKHQVSATEYEIIEVVGPQHTNNVYSYKSVITGIQESQKEDDNNFWIPLYIPAVKKLNIIEKDKLYHEAYTMVVNSYEVVKVKWYQSSFFSFILTAIAIYFAAPYLSATLGGLTAAAQAGMQAFLAAVVPIIFKSIAMQIVMELATKVLGEEFALVIAVAMVAMGMAKIDSINQFQIPFADQFLAMGSSLIKSVTTSIQQEIAAIGQAMTEFGEEAKEKMDELNALNKELNGMLAIDPYSFIGLEPLIISGESSSDYINRSLSAPRSGELSIQAVSKFVDIMLQLPEFKDSVEDVEEPEYVT